MPLAIEKIAIPEPEGQGLSIAPTITPKIIYPHEGSVLALDPDIPLSRQKVLFKASLNSKDYEWFLDGKSVGTLDQPRFWGVERGSHLMEIRKVEAAEVLDKVRFLVK